MVTAVVPGYLLIADFTAHTITSALISVRYAAPWGRMPCPYRQLVQPLRLMYYAAALCALR